MQCWAGRPIWLRSAEASVERWTPPFCGIRTSVVGWLSIQSVCSPMPPQKKRAGDVLGYVCVCVCVCAWCVGKNKIKEGDPHGSRAPVVTCGPSMNYRSAFIQPEGLTAFLSGACLGRSWGPRLGQNIWGVGVYVTSVPGRPCRATPCSRMHALLAGGGGGEALHPPPLVGPLPDGLRRLQPLRSVPLLRRRSLPPGVRTLAARVRSRGPGEIVGRRGCPACVWCGGGGVAQPPRRGCTEQRECGWLMVVAIGEEAFGVGHQLSGCCR